MSIASTDPGRFRAIILGVSGLSLTPEEVSVFQTQKPFGFILFARNIDTPEQLSHLIAQLREVSGTAHVPILIDQEGGRVARLRAPHWPEFLALGQLAATFDGERDLSACRQAFYTHARTLGGMLYRQGLTVNCAPMLDVRFPESHAGVIGDRAISARAADVAQLGQVYATGLKDAGIMPVIKHLPGHGRAVVDSHKDLPVVQATLDELRQVDLIPFQALATEAMAMTAHVVYPDVDETAPATLSQPVIETLIRGEIGFENLLMSDDLTMGALSGTAAERVTRCLGAGCDVALYCNGTFTERYEALMAASPLDGAAAVRANRVLVDMEKVIHGAIE